MIYRYDLIARKESNERKKARDIKIAKANWRKSLDEIAKREKEIDAKIKKFEKANPGLSDDELLLKMFFEG